MEGGLLSLKWNNHHSSFLELLSTIKTKDILADVTLACDGKFYPSHKLVLSTCSEYFKEMFEHTNCKHPIIVLKDIKSEEIEALLNYMYIGEVNVIQENLSGLIKSAECLKIKGLAVPDDSPPKSSEKKCLNNSNSENKRKRSETFNSIKPKETKKSKYNSDTPSTSEENTIEQQDNEQLVKQEPVDIIEVEDSKEGIMKPHSIFSEVLSSSDACDSQKLWTEEEDNYSHGPGSLDGTEMTAQDDTVHEDGIHEHLGLKFSKVQQPAMLFTEDSSICSPLGNISTYSCHSCDYKCNAKGDIYKHLRKHTGEKPFPCKWCPYASSQNSNLYTHVRKHHPKHFDNDK